MYNVQSTDYGVGVTGNYWGHLDCQVLRAPQYPNPALLKTNKLLKRQKIQKQTWPQCRIMHYRASITQLADNRLFNFSFRLLTVGVEGKLSEFNRQSMTRPHRVTVLDFCKYFWTLDWMRYTYFKFADDIHTSLYVKKQLSCSKRAAF